MLRQVLALAVPLSLCACATTRAPEIVHTAPPLVAPVSVVPPSEPAPAPAVVADDGLHGSRFTVKGGYWGSSEDELDDGFIAGVSWTNYLSKLFGLEFEVGYIDADGSDSGADFEVWSVPLMINGRINAPLWIFDVYGGLGVGGFYYDGEVTGAVTGDDDGFLWGGNAFLGGSFNIADRIALGLEGKYFVTDEISDLDAGLDAFALMLTLGFSR